jgi:hypothetical protein
VRGMRLQLLGLLAAAALVGGIALLVSRDGGGSRPGAAVVATASPTPDGRVAMFKQLTVQFLTVMNESAKTGDTKAADPLTVPGSQARGADALTAEASLKNKRNFIVTSLDFDESAWHVDPVGTLEGRYSVIGHEASWPDLTPLEGDHARGPFHIHVEFLDFNGKWLINVYK